MKFSTTQSSNHATVGREVMWPLALISVVLLGASIAWAQEKEKEVEDLLIDQEPYDLLTARDDEREETYRVFDVKLRPRRIPANPNSTTTFEFHIRSRPYDTYKIAWGNVVRLRFFEEIVLEEAKALIAKGDFINAYRFFEFLYRDHPQTIGLKEAQLDFLFLDGQKQLADKKYQLALAIFEQLYQQSPGYRNQSQTVLQAVGSAAEVVAKDFVDRSDYASTRTFLGRLESTYGNRLNPSVVSKWRMHLIDLAQERMEAAKKHRVAKDGRAAHKAASKMLAIYPKLTGGRQLKFELEKEFPLVFVSVSHTSANPDPTSIHNWGDRRAGGLVRRMLVDFTGQSFQGGEYSFPFGTVEPSENGRQLTISVTKGHTDTIDISGYDVADRLMRLADPGSPKYLPPWARLVEQIRVEKVNTVVVDLRQSHVLPNAYMNILLQDGPLPPGAEDGPYVTNVANRTKNEASYLVNPKRNLNKATQLEVVEVAYQDSQRAVAELRRGQIDIIDRVFPGDVGRLQREADIEVVPYELPTLHMLVPNRDNPYLDNLIFRRALIYGINREVILKNLLLRGRDEPESKLISGPFPKTGVASEAVGYAYSPKIDPRPYELRLAATLVILAKRQLEAMAEGIGEEPPELKKLVLAHPSGEMARIACQAIAQSLTGIGLEIELKQLPPGHTDDPARQYDLLFVDVAMWEPLTDARRLIGANGLTGSPGPYVNLALRRLDQARNWRVARQRLYALHGTVHHDLTVIPLWQLVNYYARRKNIRDVGQGQQTLYENVDQWELVVQRP